MTRFLLPLAITGLLLFSSCGKSPAISCEGTISVVDTFSICIPTGYILGTQEFGDKTSYVMYLGKASGAEQLMQVHVKKDTLTSPVTSSMEFAERAVELSRGSAPNYTPVSTEPIDVNHQPTILHIFEAQPQGAEEPVRYHQFVTLHEGVAYGFTAVVKPNTPAEELQALLTALQGIVFTEK